MKIRLISGSLGFGVHSNPEIGVFASVDTWFEVEGKRGPHQLAHNVKPTRQHAVVGDLAVNADGWIEISLGEEDIASSCNCEDGHLGPAPKGAVDQTGRCTTCGGLRQVW